MMCCIWFVPSFHLHLRLHTPTPLPTPSPSPSLPHPTSLQGFWIKSVNVTGTRVFVVFWEDRQWQWKRTGRTLQWCLRHRHEAWKRRASSALRHRAPEIYRTTLWSPLPLRLHHRHRNCLWSTKDAFSEITSCGGISSGCVAVEVQHKEVHFSVFKGSQCTRRQSWEKVFHPVNRRLHRVGNKGNLTNCFDGVMKWQSKISMNGTKDNWNLLGAKNRR